jgi:hypothetical protein
MSQVITWVVPDNYNQPVNGWPDIAGWIVQKQTGGVGPFVDIATLSATTDGLPKSASNLWIDQFEDASGTDLDWYQVAAKNSNGAIATFSVPGKGGFLSIFHGIMDLVRTDLGDDNPLFYQLDEIPQYKWTETQLAKFLKASLNDLNGSAPMVTIYNFDTLPVDVIPVLEDWVIYRALRARSIKEIANYLSYNDGVTFDMTNRPGDYNKLMQQMYAAVVERTSQYKFSHRPEAIGLGSQRLPFRVTRPLSMLPNMKNVFGF